MQSTLMTYLMTYKYTVTRFFYKFFRLRGFFNLTPNISVPLTKMAPR